jgi:hypothetical protein
MKIKRGLIVPFFVMNDNLKVFLIFITSEVGIESITLPDALKWLEFLIQLTIGVLTVIYLIKKLKKK